MLRRLFTLLSAVSLLLCVAVAALWVLTDEHPARAKGRIGAHDYGIRSGRGVVEVWRGWDPWDLMDSADPYRPLGSVAGRLGVERAGGWEPADGGFFESRGLRVPHVLIVLAASALPLVWVARRLAEHARHRAAARRPGLCPQCAYDLRATPRRCPECGAAPAGVTPTAWRVGRPPGRFPNRRESAIFSPAGRAPRPGAEVFGTGRRIRYSNALEALEWRPRDSPPAGRGAYRVRWRRERASD